MSDAPTNTSTSAPAAPAAPPPAPAVPRTTILCVQMPPEMTENLKGMAAELKDKNLTVREMSYLDGERLYEFLDEILFVCCLWDGAKGKAPLALHRFSRQLAETPARVFATLSCAVADKQKNVVPDVEADGWLALPAEFFKVQEVLGDLLRLDEPADKPNVRKEALSFTQRVHRRTLPSQFLSDLKERQEQDIARWELAKAKERKKVLVFHPDEGVGTKMTRTLDKAGFYAFHSPDLETTFTKFSQMTFDGIVAWYDPSSKQIIPVLRELFERRDQPAPMVSIFIAGPTALQSFQSEGNDIFIDSIQLLDWAKFGADVEASFQKFSTAKSPKRILEYIRGATRAARLEKPDPAKDAQVRQLLTALTAMPGKLYWGLTEDLLYSATIKADAAAIASLSQRLTGDFPNRFDAWFTFAQIVGMMNNSLKDLSTVLVQKAFELNAPTDKLTRAGRLLARHKDAPALRVLLEKWLESKTHLKDFRFWQLAALYSKLVGLASDERASLYQTLTEYSLHRPSLEALAQRFEVKKDFHYAARFWGMALTCCGPTTGSPALTQQVRCLVKMRRLNEAGEVVERVLSDDPKNAEALKIKTMLLSQPGLLK